MNTSYAPTMSPKPQTVAPAACGLEDDYAVVRRAVAFISEHCRSQPDIEAIAHACGVTPDELHHLFVTHEAMSPGEWKAGGEGLTLGYGFHSSPFGDALVVATERGLAGLAFADPDEKARALDDMRQRWPRAQFREDAARAAGLARRIFDPKLWKQDRPLRVVMIGTDFEVRVWETLLKIPMGRVIT